MSEKHGEPPVTDTDDEAEDEAQAADDEDDEQQVQPDNSEPTPERQANPLPRQALTRGK